MRDCSVMGIGVRRREAQHLTGQRRALLNAACALRDDLVTTCLGAGIVLLLVAAFFSRISKVAITGVGESDLEAAATLAGKVAEKTHGDPVKAAAMYKAAASQAAGLISQRVPTTARI